MTPNYQPLSYPTVCVPTLKYALSHLVYKQGSTSKNELFVTLNKDLVIQMVSISISSTQIVHTFSSTAAKVMLVILWRDWGLTFNVICAQICFTRAKRRRRKSSSLTYKSQTIRSLGFYHKKTYLNLKCYINKKYHHCIDLIYDY